MTKHIQRRYPVGAEPAQGGVSFRVWARDHEKVDLVLEDGTAIPLDAEGEGYFSTFLGGAGPGTLYRYRLDGEPTLWADPASRFQPKGVDAPSEVIDPAAFAWHDTGWIGLTREGQVFYELHVGTFTQGGTWLSAIEQLEKLAELGITAIEIMPVNECVGAFGWGYDGVLVYAPTRNYGSPDDFRRFVDHAHRLGIGVLLDVVYNHFGVGEVCPSFSKDYLKQGSSNDWGASINFDGPNSGPVRDYFALNAAYWIDEFHLDGIRIDATQAFGDTGADHILARIARETRKAAGQRQVLVISENEPQQAAQVRPPDQGGFGLDMLWNDDFHHSTWVALTGRTEAYYHDHAGAPQEFISAAKYGYLFQGQRYDWQDAARGSAAIDVLPNNFVHFLQNHDQIANSAVGVRIGGLVAPARLRAITALLLLGPQAPLLFQGQEFNASSPFYYFSHQVGDLAKSIRDGRVSELQQFPSARDPQFGQTLAGPSEDDTFMRSKLDWSEWDKHQPIVALHRDLIGLRKSEKAFARAARRRSVDGGVLGPRALLLRFFADQPEEDRLLLLNYGEDLALRSIPDPLAAPPPQRQWTLQWSSEALGYGGSGQRPVDMAHRWTLSANTALLMQPGPVQPHRDSTQGAMGGWQDFITASE